MVKLSPKSLFSKLAITIPLITIVFWCVSSIIVSTSLMSNMKREFASSNSKILESVARQSTNDLKFYDFYQLRRTLHDFYDESYMDYFALYTEDMKPFATYPATQFSSSDMEFIENQIIENAKNESTHNFFKALGHKRFHFQQQIKDESGDVLGYLFMGGRTKWLDKTVRTQVLYFIILGFIVLSAEIGVLVYFARKFTKPLTQLTNTLTLTQNKATEDLIPIILSQPPLEATCSEVAVFDTVVRKLLTAIQEYQKREAELSVHATLGRLTSHFGHDIRTPLSGIQQYLDFNAPSKNACKNEKETHKNIQALVKKIDMMADELTSYTKAKDIMLSVVNIYELLNEVKAGFANIPAVKKSQIIIKCPENLFAKVDKARFERVLINIILNAADAIKHDKGKIEIVGRPTSVGESSPTKVGHPDLAITIKDNGHGIKPEHLYRIFESTFTYGKHRGTGLGLAYCKNVIEAHKGTIAVESRVDAGTTFAITLPKCITKKPTALIKELPNSQTQEPTNSQTHWLVIDDTEMFREQWRNVIKRFNLPPPIEFKMPEELGAANIDYDLIGGAIVDYNYEGTNLDGFDIVELLKSKGIPKIFLCTANYNDTDVKKEAERLKVTCVIPKPIPDEFINQATGIFRPS